MEKIENYIGCSRWTNSLRTHAVHIAEIGKAPMCGKKYKAGASDTPPFNIKEVTCERCKKKLLALTKPNINK